MISLSKIGTSLVAVMLVLLVLAGSSSISWTKMTCLSSGNTQVDLGQFDGCKPPTKNPDHEESISMRCCEFLGTTLDIEETLLPKVEQVEAKSIELNPAFSPALADTVNLIEEKKQDLANNGPPPETIVRTHLRHEVFLI